MYRFEQTYKIKFHKRRDRKYKDETFVTANTKKSAVDTFRSRFRKKFWVVDSVEIPAHMRMKLNPCVSMR